MTDRMKKATLIISIVAGVIVGGAILFGILNALVGKGQWTLGWNDYRYNDAGYEIGSSSIPTDRLTSVEVDWIDGKLLILPCQDTYPSITEETEDGSELPESAQVRWKVDESGKLSIKYRKSSWFFGFGRNDRNKLLIVRIPEKMMDNLQKIDVDAVSTDVVITDVRATAIEVETTSGDLSVRGCAADTWTIDSVSGKIELVPIATPATVDVGSVSGDVTLTLPADAGFALEWETTSGRMNSDFPLSRQEELYTTGNAAARLTVETTSGNLNLKKQESK